jgi:LPXTG-motif cell wall-anchored protein
MSKLFRLIPLLLLICGVCFFPVTSVFADGEDDTAKNDIDIILSPKDTLFDISNMKPGDWAPRTITVKNSGNKDFVYQMQIQNSGEEKLFNELLLEIKAGDKELYQGKLAAFKSLSERKLTSGTEENLDITIRFPEHLGNDFQGLMSAFVFSFSVEGKESTADQVITVAQINSGGPTSAGFSLPNTSTNIFNLMLVGAVLVAGGIVLMIIRHYRRMKIAQ